MRVVDPDFPFRPDRLPFFYGWVVLVVATLAILVSIPGQTMGVSVFTEPLMAATGFSRVGLSNAYLCGTLLAGSLLPWAGTFLDRVGARVAILAGAGGLSITLFYLSVVDHAAAAVSELVGGGAEEGSSFVMLVLGFFALRFTGQGMMTLIGRTLIGRWFDRMRGVVSGASSPFVSLGFSLAPLLFAGWIDASGWRGAWMEMGLCIGLGMGLVGWLLLRDSPEECGLRMDGAEPDFRAAASEEILEAETADLQDLEPAYDRARAIRTLMFWAIVAPLTLQGLTVTGITFHILDLGAEAGLARDATIGIFPALAVVSVVASLLVGWLTNHVRLQILFAAMLLAQAGGFVAASALEHPVFYWVAVVGLGFSNGCFVPLSTVSIPHFFGRRHLGSINSTMLMCIVWGSAIGPSALAASRDLFGTYQVALLVCAAASISALLPVLRAPEPAVDVQIP